MNTVDMTRLGLDLNMSKICVVIRCNWKYVNKMENSITLVLKI